jgi:hypothetical protein
MVDPCRSACLTERTGTGFPARIFGRCIAHADLLERYGPVQQLVLGKPNQAHAAPAEQ